MFLFYSSTAHVDRYQVIGIYSCYKKIIDYLKCEFEPTSETHYFWAERRQVDHHHKFDLGLSFTLTSTKEISIAFVTSGTDEVLTVKEIEEIIDYANCDNRRARLYWEKPSEVDKKVRT